MKPVKVWHPLEAEEIPKVLAIKKKHPVKTIIVQTDTPNISSQSGGSAKISAVVFDSNNMRVARVNVLFDDQPRIGTFGELVVATDDSLPAPI